MAVPREKKHKDYLSIPILCGHYDIHTACCILNKKFKQRFGETLTQDKGARMEANNVKEIRWVRGSG